MSTETEDLIAELEREAVVSEDSARDHDIRKNLDKADFCRARAAKKRAQSAALSSSLQEVEAARSELTSQLAAMNELAESRARHIGELRLQRNRALDSYRATRAERDAAVATTREVVEAWTTPGPHADAHRDAQKSLHWRWPTLAEAVERLVATHPDVPEGEKPNG